MRRITVVDGHPDPAQTRLNHALADRYVQAARAAGHEVRRIDVARIDFPLLRNVDDFYDAAAPETLRDAQRDIAWADHLAFFYPLWHGDMPALLKAFIEQTFRPGFAMAYGGDLRFPRQLFKGKSARVVVTMGMPALIYRTYFGGYALKSFERSTLALCGIGPIFETLLGGAGGKCEKRVQKWLSLMERLAERDGAPEIQRRRELAKRGTRIALLLAGSFAAYVLAASRGKTTRSPQRTSRRASDVLAESVGQVHGWLRDINEAMGGWMSDDYALQAMRAALRPLRDYLSVEQSAHLSAQLPLMIRGIFYEEWTPSRVPVREHDEDEILTSVMRYFRGKGRTPDPKDVLRAVYGVVHHHITAGESRKAYNAMPKEIRKYWPAQAVFGEGEAATAERT